MARFMTKLARRETLGASGVVDLVFETTEGPVAFQAGQFTTVLLGTEENGKPVKRSYSIASPPADAEAIRFLVKLIPDGTGSNTWPSAPSDQSLR